MYSTWLPPTLWCISFWQALKWRGKKRKKNGERGGGGKDWQTNMGFCSDLVCSQLWNCKFWSSLLSQKGNQLKPNHMWIHCWSDLSECKKKKKQNSYIGQIEILFLHSLDLQSCLMFQTERERRTKTTQHCWSSCRSSGDLSQEAASDVGQSRRLKEGKVRMSVHRQRCVESFHYA